MPANFTGSLAISGSLLLTGSITTTGGITISGSIDSASFAATASSADNFVVRQNLTGSNVLATGTITAQTLVVQTVTSSITYSSGSNIFGNLPSNVQQFTGSLRVTGSGNHFILGGNVGIGTSSPTRILDISGSAGVLRIQNGGSVGAPSLELGVQNQGSGLFAPATNTVAITTNDTERMRIDSSGNVGIGYTPCTSYGPLQVKSPASTYTIDLVGRTSGLNGESQITFWNSGQTVVQGAIGNIARCMVFYAGGTEVMRMTCGGCVGIGATSPSGKLDVSQDQNSTSTGTFTSPHIRLSATNTTDTTGFTGIAYSTSTLTNYGFTAGTQRTGTLGSDAAFIWRYHNNSATGTEYMRITSDGVVSINCNGSFGKGAKLQILQGSSNTNALDFKNTDATYGHIGTFANNLYLTQNYYYAGGQNNDSATYGQAAITMGVSNVAGDTSIDFAMSDPGATSPSSKMRLFSVGCGVLLVGTTTCTAEASLVLGAKGTVEGGQLVLQKGTSCSCATHLDNYQDTFRIMSGTNTGSTAVNMSINHINGAAIFNGYMTAYGYQSIKGTITLASGATGTIYNVGTGTGQDGIYYVAARVGGGSQIYFATGIVSAMASAPSQLFLTSLYDGANVTLSVSGSNIRITNDGFATLTWSYSIIFQPID